MTDGMKSILIIILLIKEVKLILTLMVKYQEDIDMKMDVNTFEINLVNKI